MKVMLKVLVTSEQGTATRIFTEFPVRIGRDDGCDLRLHSRRVSRLHARIDLDGDHLVLVDEGSRNGVACNGVKSSSDTPVRLSDGDQLEIGSFKVTARISELTEPMPMHTATRSGSRQEPTALADEGSSLPREPTIRLPPPGTVRAMMDRTRTAPPPDAGFFDGLSLDPRSVSFEDIQRIAQPYLPKQRAPTDLGLDALLEGLADSVRPATPQPAAAVAIVRPPAESSSSEPTPAPERVERAPSSRFLRTMLEGVRAVLAHVLRLLGLRKPALPAAPPQPQDVPSPRAGT